MVLRVLYAAVPIIVHCDLEINENTLVSLFFDVRVEFKYYHKRGRVTKGGIYHGRIKLQPAAPAVGNWRDHLSECLHYRLPQLLRCRRLPIWKCNFYRPLTVVGIILTFSNLHHCHLNRALQFQYPVPILASTFRRRHFKHKNKSENGSSVPSSSHLILTSCRAASSITTSQRTAALYPPSS
jgi:hypothetical protein